MAGSKSDYLEKVILDLVIGAVAFTPPTTLYFILSTSAYSDAATGASCAEVSTVSTAYARVAVSNNTSNFPGATGTNPTIKSNSQAITFPTATGSWGTVQSFYVCDAPSGGNILYGADLTTAKTVSSGDTASFAANALQFQED